MPPLFDAEPEAPTAAEKEAINAEFPGHQMQMKMQIGEMEKIEPEPLPSPLDDPDNLTLNLKTSAKWLKRQDRRTKKNKGWLDERSHWTDPVPFSAENAEVEDMIKDIHLYHVQDDSDLERIEATWKRKATATPPNKRPSEEPHVQQPSPHDTQRLGRGPAPQRNLIKEWQDGPDSATPSRQAGVGAQLGEPFTPSRPSGDSPSSQSDQGADGPLFGPDDSPPRPEGSPLRQDITSPSRKDGTNARQSQAELRRQAEARAERQYWGDESPVAEQSTTSTRAEPRRSRRLSSQSSQRTPPGRVAKKRPLVIHMRSKASQLEQAISQAADQAANQSANQSADQSADQIQQSGKKSVIGRSITPYDRYVVIKDQLGNRQTEPIDRLPAPVADAINAAINDLFDDYEPRAGLVTDPDNNKTYVDSNVCVWQHIISKAKAQPARRVEAGCKTCAKNSRPCTLLQRQGSGKVIMVTYPRHDMQASHQPTDIRHWF
jgi:hypothetical protein